MSIALQISAGLTSILFFFFFEDDRKYLLTQPYTALALSFILKIILLSAGCSSSQQTVVTLPSAHFCAEITCCVLVVDIIWSAQFIHSSFRAHSSVYNFRNQRVFTSILHFCPQTFIECSQCFRGMKTSTQKMWIYFPYYVLQALTKHLLFTRHKLDTFPLIMSFIPKSHYILEVLLFKSGRQIEKIR